MTERISDDMLRVALQWIPYGGVDTEITMVAYGIDRSTFYRRIAERLKSPVQWLAPAARHSLVLSYADVVDLADDDIAPVRHVRRRLSSCSKTILRK